MQHVSRTGKPYVRYASEGGAKAQSTVQAWTQHREAGEQRRSEGGRGEKRRGAPAEGAPARAEGAATCGASEATGDPIKEQIGVGRVTVVARVA